MDKLSEKAKTLGCFHCSCCRFYHGLAKGCELPVCAYILRKDAQQDKQDTLKTAWSTLEDECKRIQDEIDRGCYSNPLDIIFEVHETISKCFEELLKK